MELRGNLRSKVIPNIGAHPRSRPAKTIENRVRVAGLKIDQGHRARRAPKIKRASRTNTAQDGAMNFTKNIGFLLLAVYLIVIGIIGLTGIGAGVLLPILALVAGIFILIGK